MSSSAYRSPDSTRNAGSNRRIKCGVCGLAEPKWRVVGLKRALTEEPRSIRRLMTKKFCDDCKNQYSEFHFRAL